MTATKPTILRATNAATKSQWRRRISARRPTAGRDGDEGSAAVYLVMFMIALVAVAGLVLDGGAALAARGRADTIAQQAARAGADALTDPTLRGGGGGLALDPQAAGTAAQAVLTAAAVDGQITVTGLQITVTVQDTRPTTILSAIGVDTVGGTATATAYALRGTTDGH